MLDARCEPASERFYPFGLTASVVSRNTKRSPLCLISSTLATYGNFELPSPPERSRQSQTPELDEREIQSHALLSFSIRRHPMVWIGLSAFRCLSIARRSMLR